MSIPDTILTQSIVAPMKRFFLLKKVVFRSIVSSFYHDRLVMPFGYLLEKAKFKLPAYALALLRALRFTLKITLSPAVKLQVEGSDVLAAVPLIHTFELVEVTATVVPQAAVPALLLL